jgi:Activator of Hsp90 ATPase homolog 1-like protein
VSSARILEVDPPRLLAFDEDGHIVRYALTPGNGGCTLAFTHVLVDADRAWRHAAGWQLRLDALAGRLDGDPTAGPPTSTPPELEAAYRRAFT